MCQWRTFVHLIKTAPKSDILVLVLTFVLTVVFDLVVAIEIGMLLACLLFIKRMSGETDIKGWRYTGQSDLDDAERARLRQIPECIRVYEITGPLFFGVSDLIGKIVVKDITRYLIIRMRSVNSLDITALNALTALCEKCKDKGVTVILSHVNEQPMRAMEKAGFVELVGKENLCANIYEAIEHAEALAAQE